MSIAALLVRFGFIYIGILAVLGVALSLLDVKSNSGINTAALLGAVMWACLSFARRNRRYFTPREKSQVVWGMLAIDLVIQAVVSLLLISGRVPADAWLFALAFIGLVHALVIYFFVGLTGKQFAKETAKKTRLSRLNERG